MIDKRGSGILMHISSLPSDCGIGTIGADAYRFVDFLVEAKQTYWQILPVGPTSYGDSPYQSFSTHAGNPYFVDFELLCEDGLLEKSDYAKLKWGVNKAKVDYAKLYENRFTVLRKAFERFKQTDMRGFNEFLQKNDNWISNYAMFMTMKGANNGKCWLEWEEGLKRRDSHALWMFKTEHADEIMFWEFIQFKFFEQWHKLKSYANEKGIKIVGDIPIYVALDSAAVWVHPDLFDLDENLVPRTVAGCPPDAFSEDGQLWGNPIYNWEKHKESGYYWWMDRLRAAEELFDVVRIDHFRGFAGYYTIPYGSANAKKGEWKTGPGIEFFNMVKERMPELEIIAEDLGFLTEDVYELLEQTGFPGMKIFEFAFDPDNESAYLPHNCVENSVAYVGTHDNETLLGWVKGLDKRVKKYIHEYLDIPSNVTEDEFAYKLIQRAFACTSRTLIIQMQDYLGLENDARMNTPAVGSGNWQWRMASKRLLSKKLAAKIAYLTKLYGRANVSEQ